MTRLHSFLLSVFWVSLLVGTMGGNVQGETWSDKTGQYKIEAEYAGVQGTNVVLRKADGTTVNVPIERLSDKSRERAKQLYQAANAKSMGSLKGTPETATPSSAAPEVTAEPSTASSVTINPLSTPAARPTFNPPVPPAVPPMPMFPEDASLQEAYDFVRVQALSGHPEVLWHALPERMRTVVDSSEYRSGIASLRQQSTTNEAVMTMLMKAVEVLVTKKDFVLNSQFLTQVPPVYRSLIQQAYDPAVGMMYEMAMLTFAMEELETRSVTEFLDDRGARFGGHLQALLKVVPPGVIDQYASQVRVQQEDPTQGTITFPKPEGGTDTIRMIRVEQRWLPEEMATKWIESGDQFADDLMAAIEKAKATQEENAGSVQQADALMGTAVAMVGGLIEPMLQAKTQQEFDLALMQVAAMAQMFSGAMPGGPAGAGAGGAFNGPGGQTPGLQGPDAFERPAFPDGPSRVPSEAFP